MMNGVIQTLVWGLRFKSPAHKLVALRLAYFVTHTDGSGMLSVLESTAMDCQMRLATFTNCVKQLTREAWFEVKYIGPHRMLYKFDAKKLEAAVLMEGDL